MKWNDIPDDLVRLIKDCLLDAADDRRRRELDLWLAADDRNRRFYERIKSPAGMARSRDEYKAFDPAVDIECLRAKMRLRARALKRRRATLWTGAAAAAVLLAVAGVRLLVDGGHNVPLIGKVSEAVVLTMSDGSVVELDESTRNSRIASQESVDIISREGTLIYESHEDSPEPEQVTYSVLNVPKGMIFDLVLEDGTHVWLNADSRLRFPSAFGPGQRHVMLEGEGYFDVRADAGRPFVVETAGQHLTVLGTRFNISAYPDAARQVTTLEEGSVSLRIPGDGTETILTPGHRAVLSCGHFEVTPVDAAEVSSWRDGIFLFDGDTLDQVFVKLSRWYNFNYVLDDQIKGKVVKGNARIPEQANPIFDIIEMIAQVEITRKGDTIYVEMKR